MLRTIHPGITLAAILLLLAAVSAATVLPATEGRNDLLQRRDRLQARIQEQQVLHDIYDNVRKKMGKLPDFQLPPLRNRTFPTGKIGEIGAIVRSLATRAGLRPLAVNPRSESVTRDEQHIRVRASLEGDLSGFRAFLLRLLSRSYVASVPELQIRSGTGEQRRIEMEFVLALG
jgi:hypothetical protein